MGKDGEAVRKTMGCKNPADVAAIQSRSVQETLRDYNNETSWLMIISTRSTNGRQGMTVGDGRHRFPAPNHP